MVFKNLGHDSFQKCVQESMLKKVQLFDTTCGDLWLVLSASFFSLRAEAH